MNQDGDIGPKVVNLFEAANVIDMRMGQDNLDGRKVMVGDVIEHDSGVKAAVNDPAVFGILAMNHKAVGLPVTKGEGFDDHFN